ncbi:MAG: hypothetical protein ACK46X_13320 [Candidatus Sericytochromatia bacterium]
MPPLVPRRHARFDSQGRLVGYLCQSGHVEADEVHAAHTWRLAEGDAAMGKQAVFGDQAGAGRITDVIFELESGEIVAYEFTDDAGDPHYLPASALTRETPAALCFPTGARDLVASDLGGLGRALDWGAEAGEFAIVEDFPDVE